MKKPVLVVMAAGMGSRYGGLKQIDPVGPNGEVIIDYSIFDGIKAGFEKVIFIIKEELLDDFKTTVGKRVSKSVQVEYVFQKLTDIPTPFKVPVDRIKPWGTCHAIWSCRDVINGPFAVINADDYYGEEAFKKVFDYLSDSANEESNLHCMVGYKIENTLTENGHVARGVCETSDDNYLVKIVERLKIQRMDNKIKFTEDEIIWEEIKEGTTVSMNLWGFKPSIIEEIDQGFRLFLEKLSEKDPLKAEYFLPAVVEELLQANKARFKVLQSNDKWFGVTYKEDKPLVVKAIRDMIEQKIYPSNLF
jgi:UTP-glucose-1-phosphate uridylyltransferase